MNLSRLLILWLAPVVFLGAGCEATLSSIPDEPSTISSSNKISSTNKISEDPKSVKEAVDRIKIAYKQVKKLLGDEDLEGVSREALRLNRYALSIVDLMQNASPKELDRARLLAQNVSEHALEVAEYAQLGDAKSARLHLGHVLEEAINALRSSVLRQAISDEKASMKHKHA